MMNRKRQQAILQFKLGQLFGPLLKMVENPTSYDSDEQVRIIARFCAEEYAYAQSFQDFTMGEPGHNYRAQYNMVHSGLQQIANVAGRLAAGQTSQDTLFMTINTFHKLWFEALFSVPTPIDSAIHEARTPFSTYCLVRDMCSTAEGRIVWMDRYMEGSLFGRYFSEASTATEITVITYPESKCSNAKDKRRYAEFMDVSRLFSLERGPNAYRLIVNDNFHARRLMVGDKMFSFDDSIKELGKNTTFTISKLDSTPENQQHFDDVIQRGVELFGPSHTAHP